MLNLTNQLLDFRKTEKERLRLNFIRTDLYELVESTFNLFLTYSEEKQISVNLNSPVNHYELAPGQGSNHKDFKQPPCQMH